MKIPPQIKIVGADGTPLKRPDGVRKDEGGKTMLVEVTLAAIIRESLLVEVDQQADGDDKMERFVIASKFFGDDIEPIEVDAKKLGIITERIGRVQSALIVGRCREILDHLGEDSPNHPDGETPNKK